MQVCTLLQTDNHTSTPPVCFFTDRMPFLPPNQQRQSTEGMTSHLRLYQHLAISNHNSFRVRLDKIVSAYSISKTHRDLYFSIGNSQPTVPVASAHFRSLLWQVTTAEVKVTVGGRPGDPCPPLKSCPVAVFLSLLQDDLIAGREVGVNE